MRNRTIQEESLNSWDSAQEMGYAQSKLIAEQLLDAAATISGVRSIVCRVGQIAGPTTEQGIWSLNEWFPSIIASSAKIGKLPSELGTMNNVDWIPVDLVAKVLVELLFASGDYLGTNPEIPAEENANIVSLLC